MEDQELKQHNSNKKEAHHRLVNEKDVFFLTQFKHDKALIETLVDVKAIASNNFINNSYKFQLKNA